MPLDPLPYAAPVFVAALAIEGFFLGGYSRRALVSAVGCAAVDQVGAAWGLALFVAAFDALHRTAAVVALPATSPLTWILAVLAHDAAYYAFHRASHRVNVLWAAHVVHHQSETYDFTVSLRQGVLATWITYAFYLPLALLVDAQVFLVVHAAYQVYQFFVHTRLVPRLGPLEWVLATPMHHRIHHGCERRWLDRNYGGFFILFDRCLGTFAREEREPAYGVPGRFEIASPLVANTYMFARLAAASGMVKSPRAWLRLWFGPPEASAHLLSAAGHATRVAERTTLLGTWAPFALGCTGAAAVTLDVLPRALAVAVGIATVVLFEIASAPLDGR